jgi:hypothetical protein
MLHEERRRPAASAVAHGLFGRCACQLRFDWRIGPFKSVADALEANVRFPISGSSERLLSRTRAG